MLRRSIRYINYTEVVLPDNCVSAIIECWGGGGSGTGINSSTGVGAGGAGGQYTRLTLNTTSLVGATLYIYVAGMTAGTLFDGSNGKDSYVYVGYLEVCRAKGGAGAIGNTPGLGSTSGGIGDVVYKGGNGDAGLLGNYGGGAGGGAGDLGNGENANTYQPGTYYSYGGTGALSQGNGLTGLIPGGGGGGALCITTGNAYGGIGTFGLVCITYVIDNGNLLYMFE